MFSKSATARDFVWTEFCIENSRDHRYRNFTEPFSWTKLDSNSLMLGSGAGDWGFSPNAPLLLRAGKPSLCVTSLSRPLNSPLLAISSWLQAQYRAYKYVPRISCQIICTDRWVPDDEIWEKVSAIDKAMRLYVPPITVELETQFIARLCF